jgi:hypothetical protein
MEKYKDRRMSFKNDDPEILWFCGDRYKLVLQFDETREPDWQNKISCSVSEESGQMRD